MYCIKCGAHLADSERQCPLCGTVVFHPDIERPSGEKLYPDGRELAQKVSPMGALFVLTMVFLLPVLVTMLCDLQINDRITWSGYVTGALLVVYAVLVLPFWFRRPNPVIFVPVGFVVAGLYLLYIDLTTGGGWFLSFAFPVTGGIGLIVTAVVTLTRYLHRGRLFIFGGAAIALGSFMLLVEFLMNLTFGRLTSIHWSLYPLAVLSLLGLTLIVVAICRPLRESLERKFFL